ncbi:hypothetical protein TWF106_008051 [Orbilia oligospora]|uniref:MYND-type domain-containing protein n=1 Tax=Orbilia oligospora TaxID=2813651 RepID=A0A7C8UWJ4_ORBOL|nr:hypothetical protein TWF106_008051 [Orbilia oligospora]
MIAVQQIDATDKILSNSNEAKVLQALIESFCELLHNFGTQMEKLDEQLAEGFYPPGTNAWSAAHVSLGEQRVLRLARRRAEDLLAALESENRVDSGFSAPVRCANCAKVAVQLMLCGRCKAVRYCGRTCQVGHYKEHRELCQATASKSGSVKK